MTFRPIVRLLSTSLFLIPAAAATAQPGPEMIAQRLLDSLRETTAVPGMGAAVWQDGRIVWEGSTGLRDVERRLPVTPDTGFRLASVSKLFTATAAAKLAEEGRLDLDAPVQAQRPWLGGRWPAMTPRQLAAHISGLPHYRDGDEALGNRHFRSGREAVAIFADRDLLSPPGTSYHYSSWGYTLLGTLIEEKAGMPFPDFISQRLVPGLAIRADATHSGDTNAAHAYEFDATKRVVEAAPHDFSYTWGGGGLSGTPGAVASFGGQLIEGRIVSPATFDAMLVPTPMAGGGHAAERDSAVGLGWRIGTDGDGSPYYHHSGVTFGARSTLGLWRDERVAVSLLSNALWVAAMPPTAMMLAAPFRAAAPGLVAAACPVDAVRYTGTLGDAPVAGTARFRIDQGLCVGTLTQDPAMAATFGSAIQPSDAPLTVIGIGIGKDGGLARAGLVTPFGIADLRAQAGGGFTAPVTSARMLTIKFDRLVQSGK